MRRCPTCRVESDDLAWSVFEGCWVRTWNAGLRSGKAREDLVSKAVVAQVDVRLAQTAYGYRLPAGEHLFSNDERDTLGMRVTERLADFMELGLVNATDASRVSALFLSDTQGVTESRQSVMRARRTTSSQVAPIPNRRQARASSGA